jgi:hypothetical protein
VIGAQPPGSIRPLVQWADKHGRVIRESLRPTDRPLEAADALFEKLASDKDRGALNNPSDLRRHLRSQAWRMVRHIDSAGRGSAAPWTDEQAWSRIKAEIARRHIRWDEERQEYVPSSPPK